MENQYKHSKRLLKYIAVGLLILVLTVLAVLLYFGIPRNAAGMAAKGVCSAAFVAGRPSDRLMEQD